MSEDNNVISFPKRTATGEVEPVKKHVLAERFGTWNYFLFTATTIGAAVVLIAAVVMRLLGLD